MVGFGRRIREARGDATSQSALGKLVGKSQSTIDNWEHENTEPSLRDFERLGKALGRSPIWLAFGDDGDVQPERMDRETVRLIVLALERRILRHRLLRPDPDGRARMILAIYDLVSQRDANDARPLTQLIEDLLDVHTGRR
jgi:transcriptional regulator with XRE-family HTH domain